MRKESFIFSLLRLLVSVAILLLLLLLYWSFSLMETDIKSIKSAIEQLTSTVHDLPQSAPLSNAAQVPKKRERNYIQEALPNLLVDDLFYDNILPELLGAGFKPEGSLETAVVGKPDNLHPLSSWYNVNVWLALCNVAVSHPTFGYFESYSPNAAIKVEARETEDHNIEYWIHLREGMYWEPLKQDHFPSSVKLDPHFLKRHPLTAHDFKLGFDVIMNPFIEESSSAALKLMFDDVLEFKVVDDLTFYVRWKGHLVEIDSQKVYRPKYIAKNITMGLTPLASFVYQFYPDGKKIIDDTKEPDPYRTNSSFAQFFLQHWAKNVIPSCGPMRFEGMSDEQIRFSRNPNYYSPYACLVEKRNITFKPIEDTIWQGFKQGALSFYSLTPEHLFDFENFLKSDAYKKQEKNGEAIHELDYLFRSFTYLGWNQTNPLFSNYRVRQALTLAIDRKRIIEQILKEMGFEIATPFYPFSKAYNPALKPYPFDPIKAKRILEEEGFYDRSGTGVLSKETPQGPLNFEFNLTYFVKNPTSKSICEFVSTALREIGIKCNLNGVDIADLTKLFEDKNFDAYLLAWALANPPEDLRSLWHSSLAKEKGSPNSIGFKNDEVDRIIEELTYEYDPARRQQLFFRFGEIFYKEVPYTLIHASKPTLLYRDNIQNVFLPIDRQDLIPGAVVSEPDDSIFWIKKR